MATRTGETACSRSHSSRFAPRTRTAPCTRPVTLESKIAMIHVFKIPAGSKLSAELRITRLYACALRATLATHLCAACEWRFVEWTTTAPATSSVSQAAPVDVLQTMTVLESTVS